MTHCIVICERGSFSRLLFFIECGFALSASELNANICIFYAQNCRHTHKTGLMQGEVQFAELDISCL